MNLDLVDPAKLNPLTEKQWMAQVKEIAGFRGWLWSHPFDSRRSTPGYPDAVLVRPPRVLFVELKSDKGVLTLDQIIWKEALEACPGISYYLWKPSQWSEVVEALE